MSTLYLKTLYVRTHIAYFHKQSQFPTPNHVFSMNSKNNKHFDKLYSLCLQHNMLHDDLLLQGYFYYAFAYKDTPISPKQLADDYLIRLYLTKGQSLGKDRASRHYRA